MKIIDFLCQTIRRLKFNTLHIYLDQLTVIVERLLYWKTAFATKPQILNEEVENKILS